MYLISPMIQHLMFGNNVFLSPHCIIAIKWFESNSMNMNSDKCHFFVLGDKFEHLWAKIGNNRI